MLVDHQRNRRLLARSRFVEHLQDSYDIRIFGWPKGFGFFGSVHVPLLPPGADLLGFCNVHLINRHFGARPMVGFPLRPLLRAQWWAARHVRATGEALWNFLFLRFTNGDYVGCFQGVENRPRSEVLYQGRRVVFVAIDRKEFRPVVRLARKGADFWFPDHQRSSEDFVQVVKGDME